MVKIERFFCCWTTIIGKFQYKKQDSDRTKNLVENETENAKRSSDSS